MTAAKPIRYAHHPESSPGQQQAFGLAIPEEHGLWMQGPQHQQLHTEESQHPSSHSHSDAAPNSVGVLFTTPNHNDDDANEVLHIWLALGKRLFTREYALTQHFGRVADINRFAGDDPFLPLHPVTARVTTIIRSTPQIATPEHLEKIVCRIYPHFNHTAEEVDETPAALEVRRRDGLTHLADLSNKPWKEVEAYECS